MIINLKEHPELIFGAIPTHEHYFSRMILGESKSSLCHSAGIRIRFCCNSKKTSLRYKCEELNTKATIGLYLQKGISISIYNNKNQLIEINGFFAKKNEELVLKENANGEDLLYEICLPSINEIVDLEIIIEDQSCLKEINNYATKAPIVFLGGAFTLGSGATFSYSTFTYQLAKRCNCNFYNLATYNANFLNKTIIENIHFQETYAIIAEINAPSYSKDHFNDNIIPYVESLCRKFDNTPKVFISQPYNLFDNETAKRDSQIKDLLEKMTGKNNTFFIDGLNSWRPFDYDKISLSNYFINDYGHYEIAKKISCLINSVI